MNYAAALELACSHGRAVLPVEPASSGELLMHSIDAVPWLKRATQQCREEDVNWVVSNLASRRSVQAARFWERYFSQAGSMLLDESRPSRVAAVKRGHLRWMAELHQVLLSRSTATATGAAKLWSPIEAELAALSPCVEVKKLVLAIMEAVTRLADATGFQSARLHVECVVDVASGAALQQQPVPLLRPGLTLDFQASIEAQLILRRHGGTVRGPCVVVTEMLYFCCHWTLLSELVKRHRLAIVMSQRVVDNNIRHGLARMGVLLIDRLSIRYITRVCTCLGVAPLQLTLATLDNPLLCFPCGQVTVQVRNGRHGISLIRSDRPDSMLSLLIPVPTRCLSDAVETAVTRAVSTVSGVLRGSMLWPERCLEATIRGYLAARAAFDGGHPIGRDVHVSRISYQLAAVASNRQPFGCATPSGVLPSLPFDGVTEEAPGGDDDGGVWVHAVPAFEAFRHMLEVGITADAIILV